MRLQDNPNVQFLGTCTEAALPLFLGKTPLVWDQKMKGLGYRSRDEHSPSPKDVWRKDGIHLPVPDPEDRKWWEMEVYGIGEGEFAIHLLPHSERPPGLSCFGGFSRWWGGPTQLAYLGYRDGRTFISSAVIGGRFGNSGTPEKYVRLLKHGEYSDFRKEWFEEIERNRKYWMEFREEIQRWSGIRRGFEIYYTQTMSVIWDGVSDHDVWDREEKMKCKAVEAAREAAVISPARREMIALSLATATPLQLLSLRALIQSKNPEGQWDLQVGEAIAALEGKRFDAEALARMVTDQELVRAMAAVS